MKATGVPTVVAVGAGDPVATGLVASLARPGGNVTGNSDNATTLSTKRLALLKQTKPNIRKVAMLWNKDDLGMTLRYQASADAAKSLGSAVQPLGVRDPNDFADAFAIMDRDLPDAILMVADALTILNRKRVFDYAAAHRLPAIYEQDLFVRDGGLMSYGADFKESLGTRRCFDRPNFQGCRAGRFTIRGTNPLSLRGQPKDGEINRSRTTSKLARSCRRSDRIARLFTALHLVCFWPEAADLECPLFRRYRRESRRDADIALR